MCDLFVYCGVCVSLWLVCVWFVCVYPGVCVSLWLVRVCVYCGVCVSLWLVCVCVPWGVCVSLWLVRVWSVSVYCGVCVECVHTPALWAGGCSVADCALSGTDPSAGWRCVWL